MVHARPGLGRIDDVYGGTSNTPLSQEQADWWDRNRAKLDLDFLAAARKGQLQRLDREQLKARVTGATKVISLRLPEADLALAREQPARKGLPYQTYLKSLLHEALRRTLK